MLALVERAAFECALAVCVVVLLPHWDRAPLSTVSCWVDVAIVLASLSHIHADVEWSLTGCGKTLVRHRIALSVFSHLFYFT